MPPPSPPPSRVDPLIHNSSPFRRFNAFVVRPILFIFILISLSPLDYIYIRTPNPLFIVNTTISPTNSRFLSNALEQNCRVVNANVLEWGMSGEVDPRPCFFLGMELLDNLPHDKIAWAVPSVLRAAGDVLPESPQSGGTEQLCEAVVVETPHGFREAFRPLRDPVIRELLSFCPDIATMVKTRGGSSNSGAAEEVASKFLGRSLAGLFGGGALRPEHRAAFVPTGSLRLVQALRKRLPRHRAILADFDSFAESAEMRAEGFDGEMVAGREGGERGKDESLMAFQAPIVSSRDPVTGSVTDHLSLIHI